jgi:hypothetical protein
MKSSGENDHDAELARMGSAESDAMWGRQEWVIDDAEDAPGENIAGDRR